MQKNHNKRKYQGYMYKENTNNITIKITSTTAEAFWHANEI